MEFNEKHSVCLIITKRNVKVSKSGILTRIMSNKKFPEPPAEPPEWSPDADPPKFRNLFGFTIN